MVTRIRQLLEQKQLTPTQFADAIGVGRPVMSHILSERNKPSLEVVQRIIDAFPEVSMSWLLRGTGAMLESSSMPAVETAIPATQLAEPTPAAPVAAVPVASQAESAPSVLPVSPVVAAAPVIVPQATALAAPANEAEGEPATSEVPLPPVAPATTAPGQPGDFEMPSPAAELPPPAALKPFKAQRFVPSSAQPSQTQATTPAAVLASAAPIAPGTAPAVAVAPAPMVAPMPFVPAPLPVEATPAPGSSLAPAVSPATPTEAALLPFLNESGKAIRRIVIFYRDGSFADYQPEQ
jgi:transcriptional regulator with XRE-family HTH domain